MQFPTAYCFLTCSSFLPPHHWCSVLEQIAKISETSNAIYFFCLWEKKNSGWSCRALECERMQVRCESTRLHGLAARTGPLSTLGHSPAKAKWCVDNRLVRAQFWMWGSHRRWLVHSTGLTVWGTLWRAHSRWTQGIEPRTSPSDGSHVAFASRRHMPEVSSGTSSDSETTSATPQNLRQTKQSHVQESGLGWDHTLCLQELLPHTVSRWVQHPTPLRRYNTGV